MRKKSPVLLVALAVTNWLPHRQTDQPNHAHSDLPATSKAELKAIRTLLKQDQPDEKRDLPFGNLRKLNLAGIGDRLVLNGIELEKITSDSINLESAKQEFQVRATFLKTAMVKDGEAVDSRDKEVLDIWSRCIPEVARVLRNKDSLGSLKPIIYELIEPKERTDLQIREELVLLYGSDPENDPKVGEVSLLPAKPFPGQVTDIQYRVPRLRGGRLSTKIKLQILFVQDESRPTILVAWVIVSKPSGEYEFYRLPQGSLDAILLDDQTSK